MMTSELRRRRASFGEQRDREGDSENTMSLTLPQDLEFKNLSYIGPSRAWYQDLDMRHLTRLDLSGYINILPNFISKIIFNPEQLKHLKYLLLQEVERNDMPERRDVEHEERSPLLPERRDVEHEERSPPLPERRDVEHDSSTLRPLFPNPVSELGDEFVIDVDYPAEDGMKPKGERMAILVTNIASIVLFAFMVFASIESKSSSIIASIFDPFFELLWGFILWLTSCAMQNPNPRKYPIGMKRLQPVVSHSTQQL